MIIIPTAKPAPRDKHFTSKSAIFISVIETTTLWPFFVKSHWKTKRAVVATLGTTCTSSYYIRQQPKVGRLFVFSISPLNR